ncbi:MAG: hypothetical protein ACFHX7_02115 [Pseudomonadota bacterium]
MLLVKPPDRADLLHILEGLIEGRLTREEVGSWYQAVAADPLDLHLSGADGFWYFHSLSAITVPIGIEAGESWFIRRRDLQEYVLDLKGVGSDAHYQGITRVRAHQADNTALRWPLLMVEHTDAGRLDELGLCPVRGVFDEHGDLLEHTHLLYQGELYLVVRQYDDQAHQLMILGTSRDQERLGEFLAILGLS